jgi:Protein of unknown function (DUF3500)
MPAGPRLGSLDRRSFLLGAGAAAGWLVARGLGAASPFAGGAEPAPGSALRALAASLTPRQRELIVLPLDHPSRQIVNTLTVLERPHLGTLLSPGQRALAERLYLSMLSPRGRDAFAGTVAIEGRLDGAVLAVYGEPEREDAQAVIQGGHLMLRSGGGDGAAFGGGVAYGHQIGNRRWRVPGNSFAYHGDAANRLYASLDAAERTRAVRPTPPHELVLQVQGRSGSFEGVQVASLSEAAREEAARLLGTVLSCYPEEEQARARDCIEGNGGLGALHVAFFASHGFYEDMQPWGALAADERARRGDPYWQVWRIEGPGTIVHFQGHPHVHAYIQVVRDPARANVGEALASAPATVEGETLRRLLEGALREATGEPLAFHPAEIPGRFCPGEITTGVAYALDPYRNHLVVAEIDGRAMAAPLRERLAAAGAEPAPERRYRVATVSYAASRSDWFGEPERVEPSELLLRDALVAHLRAGGFAAARG